MDKDSFELLLAPLEELKQGLPRGAKKGADEKTGLDEDRPQIIFKDLRSLGLLGCGGFGAVELVQHKQDREAAKADMSKAQTIRDNEHEEFVASTGDQKSNLDAMTGALAALEKGMGASFLQSKSAALLNAVKKYSGSAVDSYQKDEVVSLLQGKNPFGDYSGRSGEIIGILKAMKDEMDKDLGGAVAAEETAAAGFEELKAAKTAEISAASEAIESKSVRTGELAVSVTTTADDIEDTTAEMKETQAFVANLASQCAAKKKEWDERCAMRTEEISAISEAIKILNDDDALDLFKKTLSLSQTPSAFLQRRSGASVALRARTVLSKVAASAGSQQNALALLGFQLKAKKVDFSKILAQIDGMMKVLDSDQANDDEQQKFCEAEISKTDKEHAATKDAIATSAASIEEMSDESAALASEIATLQDEIKALDKAVAEATEQRKEEHADSIVFLQENDMAIQLIEKAKNALNKFYRPNLHKEEPKRELTEEEKLVVASGGADPRDAEAAAVFAQLDDDAAPPPPPDTWGAYQKKDGKSNGVMALMDMLVKELKDGITEAEHEEETAQKDYERLMSDSQASREKSVESITAKEAAKADLDTKVVSTKEQKASQEAALMNLEGTLAQLHADCDFLLENYDVRKAARVSEKEGLVNAKSVLSGANFE